MPKSGTLPCLSQPISKVAADVANAEITAISGDDLIW
jgi:hypothetical protein